METTTYWATLLPEFATLTEQLETIKSGLLDAEVLRKVDAEAGIPESKRRSLPKKHTVYAVAKKHFRQLFKKHAANGELRYSTLVLLFVEVSKLRQSVSAAIYEDVRFRKSAPEIPQIIRLLESRPPIGVLHDAYHQSNSDFFSTDEKDSWERGFRAGIAFSKKPPEMQKAPNRRNVRSVQFWMTYAAWITVLTDHTISKKLDKTESLIVALIGLGVIEREGRLGFPAGKHGVMKFMTKSTFRDNLTGWKKDFQAMAQF